MEKTGATDDMPIQAGMVTKAIESAQRQVEAMHFAARKNVLEYDDVMNLQRNAIYKERNAILDGKDLSSRIEEIVDDEVDAVIDENCPAKLPSDDWDMKAVDVWAANKLPSRPRKSTTKTTPRLSKTPLRNISWARIAPRKKPLAPTRCASSKARLCCASWMCVG